MFNCFSTSFWLLETVFISSLWWNWCTGPTISSNFVYQFRYLHKILPKTSLKSAAAPLGMSFWWCWGTAVVLFCCVWVFLFIWFSWAASGIIKISQVCRKLKARIPSDWFSRRVWKQQKLQTWSGFSSFSCVYSWVYSILICFYYSDLLCFLPLFLFWLKAADWVVLSGWLDHVQCLVTVQISRVTAGGGCGAGGAAPPTGLGFSLGNPGLSGWGLAAFLGFIGSTRVKNLSCSSRLMIRAGRGAFEPGNFESVSMASVLLNWIC